MVETQRHVVGWFEIPVLDIARAVAFYQHLFGFEMHVSPLGDMQMAFFPGDYEKDLPGSMGALVMGVKRKPSTGGTLVYFTSPTGDCAHEQRKAQEMGANVIVEKYEIPEGHGFMVVVEDSEGNHIAIHSRK